MQWTVPTPRRFAKRTRFFIWAIAVFIAVLVGTGRQPAMANQALHYTELEFPPLPEITIPEYTQFTLDNGLQVYLMEDHELPLVSGTAYIYTGDRLEPGNQVGLASIVGEVMRTGGTTTYPANELNEFLEQRAASVETGIGTTAGSAGFSTLTEDLPDVFDRFAAVLREPAFPQEKLDLAVRQREGSIARRNDDPEEILGREFIKLVYGETSPYARTVEYGTLNNISRDDVVSFYQQYYAPNNMMLGIVGDFDPTEMRSRIEQAFGDWQLNPDLPRRVSVGPVIQAQRSRVFMIDQPQLSQSYVQLGHLGDTLDSPDYAALSVVNEVLNGLGGRLVNEVRSRQGLAYLVYAYWSPQFDYPGVFIAGGQTRSEATVPFIQATLAEIERVRTTPISPEELAQAQESVLNSFVFNFQTPGQTLSRVMRYDLYDYPEDFIFQYRRQLEAVTVEQVQQAAATHLKPEDIVTLVVGNQAAIQPPLDVLQPGSEVTQLDITIPDLQG
ncbi:MAG: pitrilysin family protein [Synechococcales bacterium]|nr:pitrilysin family protein [Synechococcales bacterium]